MRKLATSVRCGRGGVTVMEAMVALVIIASAATVGTKTLLSAASHRRHVDQREAASLEVANAMERLAGGKIEPLDAVRREALPLSPEASRLLSQAEMTLIAWPAEPAESGVLSQRVTVELVWKNGAGQQVSPARLTAWRHAAVLEGASP